MSLLKPDYSPISNFIAIRGYAEISENIITTCEGYINKTVIRFSNSSDEGAQHSLEDLSKSTLGDIVKKVKRYESIIKTLTTHIGELTELTQYCVQNIKYYTAQYLIKRLQLLALKVKKLVLTVKVKISKLLQNILKAVLSCRAAGATSALLMPILTALQVVGMLIGAALAAIESLLKLIPDPIAVKPSAMAFFPTPKSMKKVDIVAINTNTSICDRLPEPIKVGIREAVKITDKLNVPIKLAIVAACAASGAAQAKSKNKDFKIIGCKRLSLLDPQKIIKAIEFLVGLLPIPQALPKYEKLSIINLGYLAWLLTSFELAGKRSFGMMGMP